VSERSTRRSFLSAAGAAGVGAALAAQPAAAADSAHAGGQDAIAFFGSHQAGIATPTQQYLQFAALDFVSDSVADLGDVLGQLSATAALLTRGLPVGPMRTGLAPPVDTGESVGLGPARITITFGLGPRVFARGRFGLEHLRPAPLVELPTFNGDQLDPAVSGGDLCVQVCAEDPQVAFHAVHDLIRLAAPAALPRWLLSGFGRISNSRAQTTPRNLIGFKDGTDNIIVEDQRELERFVWAGAPESPAWMRGGAYLVVRRIEILLTPWDDSGLYQQQQTIGRNKLSGAPLGARREHDPPDLRARSGGSLVIPGDAHIRLASPSYNRGQRILRRGYSYVDGVANGSPATGLLFLCYQRDPRRQFIPIQRRLAASDALNAFVQPVGSAIFACPPGTQPGGYVGETLLGGG
jgi:deferrochelatase/peroxidase EfeB